MTAGLPVFLTAFDPAELPGGSVDPLGFTAGYLALADEFFPGMTAAAGQGTYLPMLCAGLHIAEQHGSLGGLSASAARKARVEIAMRFERYWALACVLHAGKEVDDDGAEEHEVANDRIPGLRGVSYARRARERLLHSGTTSTGASFALLAEQYRYGAFGIYGSVGEAFRLFDKSTFALTRGFGDAIGMGFLEATSDGAWRRELVRAVCDANASVRVAALERWGELAFVNRPLQGASRGLFREALVYESRRARTLEALSAAEDAGDSAWSDVQWLERCTKQLRDEDDARLLAAIVAAGAYDAFLRRVTLIFERVLWLCRNRGDRVPMTTVFDDSVVQRTSEGVSNAARDFVARAEVANGLGVREVASNGRGVLELARDLAVMDSHASVVNRIVTRHGSIQRAKVERGRTKQPWVEQ